MSELLISDGVVDPLEDCDAELPCVRDFEDMLMMEGSVSVTFMIGGFVVAISVVGEGMDGGLSEYDSFT